MTKRDVDIKDFSSRVERMCEFILLQMEETTESPDKTFIQNLKRDAIDIQFNSKLHGDILLRGLDDHVRGIIHTV